MFIEEVGLKVITGPMFSEKSGELIHSLNIAEAYEGKKVVVFKPDIETRDGKCKVVSRTGLVRSAIELPEVITKEDIEGTIRLCEAYDVIGFDETQFFKGKIVELLQALIFTKRVIVSGLNMDYEGIPFGRMGDIIALADEIEHLYPVCASCKKRRAIFSQRLSNGKPVTVKGQTIQQGDKESYEPRCRVCFVPPTE
jgi:thymidine kinase